VIIDSLAPARSVATRPRASPYSFRRFPSGSSGSDYLKILVDDPAREMKTGRQFCRLTKPKFMVMLANNIDTFFAILKSSVEAQEIDGLCLNRHHAVKMNCQYE
jgi:hypothetical protein